MTPALTHARRLYGQPDQWPGYDIVIDFVKNYYRVNGREAFNPDGFLSLPDVLRNADPLPGFKSTGFTTQDTYGVNIVMPAGTAFSFYAAMDVPSSDANYPVILAPSVFGEVTFPNIVREGFSLQCRTGCIVNSSTVGTDTNLGVMTSTGEKVGMTVSGTHVKYYLNNAKGLDLSTTSFATHLLNRFWLGDAMAANGNRWNADIKLYLVKYTEDSEADAAAWTN